MCRPSQNLDKETQSYALLETDRNTHLESAGATKTTSLSPNIKASGTSNISKKVQSPQRKQQEMLGVRGHLTDCLTNNWVWKTPQKCRALLTCLCLLTQGLDHSPSFHLLKSNHHF